MNLTRLLMVAGFALLGATGSQAAFIPGHFEINLNDNGCIPSLPNAIPVVTCTGGWGDGTTFTDQVFSTPVSTSGFTKGCFPKEAEVCEGDSEGGDGGDIGGGGGDPYISINKGGHSLPFGLSFAADANGGGILDFFNGGPQIKAILITIPNFDSTQIYQCQSDIFSFCGFRDPVGTGYALFEFGTIPTATPEPAPSILLLIACGAMIACHRMRSRKASA